MLTLAVLKVDLSTRIKSMIIDSVVIILLMTIVSYTFTIMEMNATWPRVLAFALVWLYEPICVTLGRTLGQKIMGIQVKTLDMETHRLSKVSFFRSLVRYGIKLILGIVSLFTIHSDPNGKGVHDSVVGTVMVYS